MAPVLLALLVVLLSVALLGAVRATRAVLAYRLNARRLACFPEPPRHSWLLGHFGIIRNTEEGLRTVCEIVRRFKVSNLTWFGPFPFIRLYHPDYVKSVLMASASVAEKDDFFYRLLRPWLGDGLLLSRGQRWSRQRHLLTPAFHFSILQPYVSVFDRSISAMHAGWTEMLRSGKSSVNVFESVSLMTLDSLLKCTFGQDNICQQESSRYISAVYELSKLVIKREFNFLHYPDAIYWLSANGRRARHLCTLVHDYSLGAVRRRRTALSQGGRPGKFPDFIDIVLLARDEDGKGMTDDDIQAEVDTFMFEGHDTTASGISWALYNLARHPEYQQRCRQEVTQLLQAKNGGGLEWDDLSQLPYLTMCLKESLRLHPPVTAVARACTQDVTLTDGRVIPKGNTVIISVFGTHHNPLVWPDPEVYDPERFSADKVDKISPHAFIPFSAGPRNCIGQRFAMAEMKVALALTLARFRIAVDATRAVRRLPELVMRAEGGLWLTVEPIGDPPSTPRH
uniref:Cytochrome P450 4F3-like n=1 Tax=Petromyzon marinus TaxID=7757 RepID=A0AAJ7U0Y6_PETMA|nr:cytochrome P450 4F3-like [Petromyzon marinus]XP_032826632.1 cytochrome P450 4F3-like [Petromyzon marinus]XP_032826633.1 cytochrome P450 4F3-like [Petromyzon marinus]XP_032826635.1 cytochrome P450 4F3-like [Petromyzon marinus]